METTIERNVVYGTPAVNNSTASAVSWGAIVAGAVAAAALSLILFILGIGLGLTSVSPWSEEGISGAAFGISAILWITFTSLVASALGGYLTGRLRTRWLSVHTDEVYFRGAAYNAQIGNKDKAFEYLEKSYQRRELWMSYLHVDPLLDSLRDDPRFEELVRRVERK